MSRQSRGKTRAKGTGANRIVRNDAEEALEDSQAEVNDVSAALSTPAAGAGESAGPSDRRALPEGVLLRRLDKAKLEKEEAIKEKEKIQQKMDEMQAELALAHAKVGAVVSVDSPITPSANKVRLKLL